MQSSTALRYRLVSTDLCASILVLTKFAPGKWSARIWEGVIENARHIFWLLKTKDTEGAEHRILSAD